VRADYHWAMGTIITSFRKDVLATLLRQGRRDLALAYAHHVVAKRGLFYHGTSTTLAKHILSEGFVPNPKKKIWDGETGVQQSYIGTYFTSRVATGNRYADGAARKFGGYPVVFEVQLETRTGLFDEDEIAPVAGETLWQIEEERDLKDLGFYLAAVKLSNDPARLRGFSDEVLTRWIGTGEESYRAQPFAQLYRSRFGDVPIHPKYFEAVAGAVRAAVEAFIKDIAETKNTDGGKRYRAANSMLMKTLNLSKYGPHPQGSWTQNIRIVEPVTFRGANRILAAVSRHIDVDYAANVKTNTFWVLYGKPSKALVTDNDDRYEVVNVVKRGWPKPAR